MKFVNTRRRHEALTVGDRTVTSVPVEVSNEDATTIMKAGESVGVAVEVHDEPPEGRVIRASSTPDLSAGVGSVSGTGDPVTNTTDGVTPVGDDGAGNPPATDEKAATGGRGRRS